MFLEFFCQLKRNTLKILMQTVMMLQTVRLMGLKHFILGLVVLCCLLRLTLLLLLLNLSIKLWHVTTYTICAEDMIDSANHVKYFINDKLQK